MKKAADESGPQGSKDCRLAWDTDPKTMTPGSPVIHVEPGARSEILVRSRKQSPGGKLNGLPATFSNRFDPPKQRTGAAWDYLQT